MFPRFSQFLQFFLTTFHEYKIPPLCTLLIAQHSIKYALFFFLANFSASLLTWLNPQHQILPILLPSPVHVDDLHSQFPNNCANKIFIFWFLFCIGSLGGRRGLAFGCISGLVEKASLLDYFLSLSVPNFLILQTGTRLRSVFRGGVSDESRNDKERYDFREFDFLSCCWGFKQFWNPTNAAF